MSDYRNYDYSIIFIKPSQDTVSFTGSSVMKLKDFKKLCPYMSCLYTGKPMLTNNQLEKMKKGGFFQGSIIDFVTNLKPYKDIYLEPIERNVFEIIEHNAQKHPDMSINELFNKLYKISLENVRKEQKPIIDRIKNLGELLPDDYKKEFFEYMKIVDKKLAGEPVLQKFSFKEFKYKITKLAEPTTDEGLKQKINEMLSILEQNKENYKIESKIKVFFNTTTHKQNKTVVKNVTNIDIIDTIRDFAHKKGFKRIAKLCNDNISMLKENPVYVPFSNKSFVYDLENILKDLSNEELRSKILGYAHELPNSLNSVNALILKFKDCDSEIIGDRLFNPALVSIEHLVPASLGGEDSIANCALTRRRPNSERKSEPLYVTLQRYPRKNQQKYVNKMITLVKKGLLDKDDALAQIKTIEEQGHIKLDIAKLLNYDFYNANYKQKLVIDPQIFKHSKSKELRKLKVLKKLYKSEQYNLIQVGLQRNKHLNNYNIIIKENGKVIDILRNESNKKIDINELINYLRGLLLDKC